jgi:putative SOS response-associated peptidase YedK
MCGRYAMSANVADLSTVFGASDELDHELVPRYNIAPMTRVVVVRRTAKSPGPVLSSARWGLVPHWSRDDRIGARMINARAETVATSRAFAPAFASRRCIVPATGWYEWLRVSDKRKQPYFMSASDNELLGFAGLWELNASLLTCTILTTAALGDLALVHDRMPVVLPGERWTDWLGPGEYPDRLSSLPGEVLNPKIEMRPVGQMVGNVGNDGPELLAAVPAAALAEATPNSPARPDDLRLF